MGFVRATDTTGLSVGNKKMVVVDGKEILLTNIDGSYYAIANRCPHMGGSLVKGILEDGIITCPRHGSKFDVKTGRAVGGPTILFMKFKVKDDRSYPVKLEGSDIFIDLEK
ncbi:Rieske (2Fe-2S) protein [Acetobacterium bakii]|uniref:Rieske domain-containing protein n=1 Tax=Acetobacterium bakii TaxID=52689 RepID=A0A0L6U287_9FIRM|nr:Rieske 2Fe-2S domain-containing protein [Acetobacterium bakii]KNZ42626.1 hypothetical protein AKG39_05620 [Acetobacterium bakii]